MKTQPPSVMSGRMVLAALAGLIGIASAALWAMGVGFRPTAAVEWHGIEDSLLRRRSQLEWSDASGKSKTLVWQLSRAAASEDWELRQLIEGQVSAAEPDGVVRDADLEVARKHARATWTRYPDLSTVQLRHWVRASMTPAGQWSQELATRRRAKRRVWMETQGAHARIVAWQSIAGVEQRTEGCKRTLVQVSKMAETEPARWRLEWNRPPHADQGCELRVIFADQTIEELEAP